MEVETLEKFVPELFQVANAKHLQPEQAIELIVQNSGIIPVAITTEYRVIWLDVGDYPYKEWKFRYATRNLIEQRGLSNCFTTDIQLLARKELALDDHQNPAGFIFHMSKCGSTLVAKVLDQPDTQMIIKEPTPLHENFWQYLTNNWQDPVAPTEDNLRLIRNLIQILGRDRLPNQESYFVRFRSWNIAFVEIIQLAFPDTPCLFIYRDPVKVMASILNKPTTGLPRLNESNAAAFITKRSKIELTQMDALHYFTSFYKQYLYLGLNKMKNTHYLNYRLLNKQNIDQILRTAYNYSATKTDLPIMQMQFDTYSKDDTSTVRFVSDRKEKKKQVTTAMREAAEEHLMTMYYLLEESEQNLNKVLNQHTDKNLIKEGDIATQQVITGLKHDF